MVHIDVDQFEVPGLEMGRIMDSGKSMVTLLGCVGCLVAGFVHFRMVQRTQN